MLATQMEVAADQAKKNGLRQRNHRKGNPSAGCAFQITQKYEQQPHRPAKPHATTPPPLPHVSPALDPALISTPLSVLLQMLNANLVIKGVILPVYAIPPQLAKCMRCSYLM